MTLDLHRLPGGHPDVHVTPVGRGGDSWEAVRNLTDQCFCAGRNSPDTAHVIYMEVSWHGGRSIYGYKFIHHHRT